MPDNWLAWYKPGAFGFSDSADIFVFVSGYAAALALCQPSLLESLSIVVLEALGHDVAVHHGGVRAVGFGGGGAHKFGRPHQLVGQRLFLAADDTDAAAQAFFADDRGLELPGTRDLFHFDRVERAALQAVLTARALFLVDPGPKAAGPQKVEAVGFLERKKDLAAFNAAEAGAGIDQSRFLVVPHDFQGLGKSFSATAKSTFVPC